MSTFVGTAIQGNKILWTKAVGMAWDRISLTEKLIWIFFLGNTIALITLIEMIALGK